MVVIECPTAALTGVTQDRLGIPSKCTVQAPHSAAPQPNLVPFMPSRSRRNQSSGMSGGASRVWVFPLIFKVVMTSPSVLRFSRLPSPRARSLDGCRRVLDDLRDLLRMRQERDVARRDLGRPRAHALRVEPFEVGVDCVVLLRNDEPGGNGLPRGGGDRRLKNRVVQRL